MAALDNLLDEAEKLLAELATLGLAGSASLRDEIETVAGKLAGVRLSTLAQVLRSAVEAGPEERLGRISQGLVAVQQIRLRLLRPEKAPGTERRLPVGRGQNERGILVVDAPEGEQSLAYLGKALESGNDLLRTWAANKLAGMGDEAVPILREKGLKWAGCVGKLALAALESVGTPAAIKAVIELSSKPTLKRPVVTLLVDLGAKAFPYILETGEGRNEPQREAMAQALWWLEKGSDHPHLADYLNWLTAGSKTRTDFEGLLNVQRDLKKSGSTQVTASSLVSGTTSRYRNVAGNWAMTILLLTLEEPDAPYSAGYITSSQFFGSPENARFLWGSGLEQTVVKNATQQLQSLLYANKSAVYEVYALAELGDINTLLLLQRLETKSGGRYEEAMARLVGNMLEGSLTPLALERYRATGRREWKTALEKLNDPGVSKG